MHLRPPFSILLVALAWLAQPVLAASDQGLNFEPCRVTMGAVSEDGDCAALTRLENPQDPQSKQLELFAVKFAAKSPARASDAFTIIQGGPGMSSIDLYLSRRASFANIRQNRDILLIDQRGTGRSHAFTCPMPDDLTIVPTPVVSKSLAQTCLQDFDGNAKYYTTTQAIDDLEALRQLAGYPQLTIYGVSYGTRVGVEYARAYPDQTRALVLDGVVPPTVNLAGNEIAIRSQQAFDAVAERCANLAECVEAHGDLKRKFRQAREDLSAGPVRVKLAHPRTGKQLERDISEMDLLAVVRLMPYTTESLALLPLLLSQSAEKNYTMLASQVILIEEDFFANYAVGMNNSVLCTEDYPYLTSEQKQARANTFFGDTMIDTIAATCEVWPRGNDYSASRQPIKTEIPALIMSGELDPITPPENGQMLADMLSNARHVVVPGHGHGVFDRGCMNQLVTEFVKEPNFSEFDASCVERERAFPLFLSPLGPAQ